MKTIKLILLLAIVFKNAYSQNATKYRYVLNERIETTQSKTPLLGMEHEFVTKRVYYSPIIFSEKRLFTGDDTKSILFKIKNGVWYYKANGKWELFYDFHNLSGGVISLFGVKYKITFKKEVNIRHTVLHKIILEPIGISQSHNSEYFLNFQKGVLIIRSGGYVLLRADSFKNALTDDEVNTL